MSACCCGDTTIEEKRIVIDSCCDTQVYEIGTDLRFKERLGMILCRVSNRFRMNYAVSPGLYKIGTPDRNSPVLVTSNYKLTFDVVRKNLAAQNCWLLVLDTKGINVWCAAGKGSFGTQELINRIKSVGLNKIVSHKKIVLPQLGAPGVRAHQVQKESGFRVEYGPVYAKDIVVYLANGMKKEAAMRQIHFSFWNRLVLAPIELINGGKHFLYAILGIAIVAGLSSKGILFEEIWSRGVSLFIGGMSALLAGTLLFPVLLPLIPFRAFFVKGYLLGLIVQLVLFYFFPVMQKGGIFMTIILLGVLPLYTSWLAFNFTGSTTYTNVSGVKKELKRALPLYLTGAALGVISLILYKITMWGAA